MSEAIIFIAILLTPFILVFSLRYILNRFKNKREDINKAIFDADTLANNLEIKLKSYNIQNGAITVLISWVSEALRLFDYLDNTPDKYIEECFRLIQHFAKKYDIEFNKLEEDILRDILEYIILKKYI